jgi:serine protease
MLPQSPHVAIVGLMALALSGCTEAFAQDADRYRQGFAPQPGITQAQQKLPAELAPQTYLSYYIDLPSNVETLTVTTAGGSGNVDLFLRSGIEHRADSYEQLVAQSVATSTTPGNSESISLRRGASSPLTPGRWWMTVANTGSNRTTVDLQANFTVAGTGFTAGLQQSGTWYEPAKSQQGLFVEFLSPAQAAVVWFTFTPEGEQAWMLGVGAVSGDTIQVPSFNRSRGARFGEAFNTRDVVFEDVGDLLITFDACGSGYASFLSSRPEWPNEQLRIQQLSGVEGLACARSAQKAPNYVGSGLSGSWYNPERSGEGWLFQKLNADLAVAYWFTYDSQGNQAWVGGVGEFVDGAIIVNEVVQPVGGRFGPNYSPSQVTRIPWGSMAMSFKDCKNATMQSFGREGYGQYGSNNWRQLTQIAGTPNCDLRTTPLALAATVQAMPFSSTDGDVNDPAVSNVDNDSPQQVQSIGNPQAVAGYLTAQATGREGDRFANSNDTIDAYRATLTAGQSLQLIIADWQASNPTAIDFDLFLYRAGDASTPVQTAVGTDRNEYLTIGQTGSYDIVVQAYAGRGNYTLVLSNAPAPASALALALEDDASKSEIIVRFDEPFDDGKAPTALYKSTQQRSRDIGLPMKRGQPGRSQLYAIPSGASRKSALAGLGVDTAKQPLAHGWGLSAQQVEAYEWAQTIKALRARNDVRHAEPNTRMYPTAVPTDPRYREQQWHYGMINLPAAFDVSQGSPNVLVAVLDTGVNPHPDIEANVRRDLGADTVTDPLKVADGDGLDRDASDPGDGDGSTRPDSFHGTHVAGTVAALANNSRGGVGVAPAARVSPLRVLGRGGGDQFSVDLGIQWASGLLINGLGQAGRSADVINMSLGGARACSGGQAASIAAARAAGAIVIAAAGNDNSSGPFTPADCPGVVKVAAVGPDYLPANYSNCRDIDVVAPGGETATDAAVASRLSVSPSACKGSLGSVYSGPESGVFSLNSSRFSLNTEGYKSQQGTSMAAPHVAGVAALMRSVYPSLSPAEFDAMLANGELSFDPRSIGVSLPASIVSNYAFHYGPGIIDANKAVRAAASRAGGAAPTAAVVAQPSALDFGELTNSLVLDVSRVGAGSIGVRAIGSNASWLRGSGGGAEGLGRYTLTVNRSGLPSADYTDTIQIDTTDGKRLSIPVSMRVGPRETVGKAAQVYVLLIDAITLQVSQERQINAASGTATIEFSTVYPGGYYLIYGTDLDNDGFVCDEGEFCGTVPDLQTFAPLDVRGGNLSIDFAPLFPDLSGLGAKSSSADPMAGLRGSMKRRHSDVALPAKE